MDMTLRDKSNLTQLKELMNSAGSDQHDFEEFFERLPEPACVANERHFLRVNAACIRLLGYDEAEMLATPWRELLHPDDLSATEGATDSMYSGDLSCFYNRLRRKDGSYRWLKWKALRWNDKGKTYSCAEDVTDDPVYRQVLAELTAERKTVGG